MADKSNKSNLSPGNSPRVPRHATQMLPEELTPKRKAALKVPLHATQALPDVLLHAKEELHSPSTETNFVIFEKHLLANHIGSLGDCMIYNKHPLHPLGGDDNDQDEDEPVPNSQITPEAAPKPKVGKEDVMKSGQSGSFDMMAECFYSDH